MSIGRSRRGNKAVKGRFIGHAWTRAQDFIGVVEYPFWKASSTFAVARSKRQAFGSSKAAHGSADGIRDAARNRNAARAAVAAANTYITDASFEAALAALDVDKAERPERPGKVVGARFGPPLNPRPTIAEPETAKPDEYMSNFDAFLAAKRSKGGKPA
ncbi:hypothetical protein [Rhodovulum visakhapatnamense]|uniref:hypothetical protein n=1 Tax=Rhodovulum visakhapatnamense TaxID=364297 RepID=UPI001064C40A|nr:hypothetical protein [Rhodovulum visakhapatnamense]